MTTCIFTNTPAMFVCLFVCLRNMPSSARSIIAMDTAVGTGLVALPFRLALIWVLLHSQAREVQPSFIDHAPYRYNVCYSPLWVGSASTCVWGGGGSINFISLLFHAEGREDALHPASHVWEPNRMPDHKVEQFLVVARLVTVMLQTTQYSTLQPHPKYEAKHVACVQAYTQRQKGTHQTNTS